MKSVSKQSAKYTVVQEENVTLLEVGEGRWQSGHWDRVREGSLGVVTSK